MCRKSETDEIEVPVQSGHMNQTCLVNTIKNSRNNGFVESKVEQVRKIKLNTRVIDVRFSESSRYSEIRIRASIQRILK